jgi:DNA-binding MarR family transcriptional regulator
MAAHELVERVECDDDSRGTWIRVTPRGHRVMLKATRGHAAAVRTLFFDALSDAELDAVHSASQKILAEIGRADKPGRK